MRSFIYVSILSICFIISIFPQVPDTEYFKKNLEVYFEFYINNREELNTLTRIISIDKLEGTLVRAYANQDEWNNFIRLNYSYSLLPHPGDASDVTMSGPSAKLGQWDTYPTYDAYVLLMSQFSMLYPNLCRIVDAGNTVNGRKILFAVISDNVNVREAEPQFMYSSTMHGDETTGYVLMLRLIDSLLTSYGSDPRITNLVNNVEIWINPNGNPDGTYYSGNHTVVGARRYNANGKDLNRNFPDPQAGPNPTGAWQPETIAMMSLADSNRFVLSANFHGGIEVVNYPWDAWQRLHPDNNWYVQISRKYADTAQANSPNGYMNDLNNGITNGYAWYQVFGGRQDFFTYFKRGRELTIELSTTKLVPSSTLPLYWNYNKLSLLSYIENCLYGLRGIVTDTSGNPLKAKVSITAHDFDSSEIFTDYRNGNYHRLLSPGTYSITFAADSFISKTFSNVTISHNNTTELNVQLSRMIIPVELISFEAFYNNGKVELRWKTATELNNHGFEIHRKEISNEWTKIGFVKGNSTTTESSFYSFTDNSAQGVKYRYRLKQLDYDGSFSFSEEVEIQPDVLTFELFQNYPNPFNPSTKIKYSLKEPGFVSLKLFDVLGGEAAVLVNSAKEAGIYEYSFDAFELSSGVYILKLSMTSTDGLVKEINKKINLVK